MPISRDGSFGPNILIELAEVNVMLGRHDEAITQLETALAVPSCISPASLRADPSWAALRGNPRFERLAAQPAPTPPPAK